MLISAQEESPWSPDTGGGGEEESCCNQMMNEELGCDADWR